MLVDGVEHKCEGSVSGGVRTSVLSGQDIKEYVLAWVPTYGFFGTRSGTPKRLGEGKTTVSGRIDVERVGGNIDTEVTLIIETDSAPSMAFHSSAAFDTATDAQELTGDGVLSLSHTAGGSDRGAFGGVAWTAGASSSTSLTYGGTGMTEVWDVTDGTFYFTAGYHWPGGSTLPTGSQTATSTVNTTPDDHTLTINSMTGVHQTTPVGTQQTATGGSTSQTVTVGSVGADDLVVDHLLVTDPTGITIGADQTQRSTEATAGHSMYNSTQLGSSGGVMSWSWTNNAINILGAIAFKPVAAGGAALLPFITGDLSGIGSPGRFFKDPLQ